MSTEYVLIDEGIPGPPEMRSSTLLDFIPYVDREVRDDLQGTYVNVCDRVVRLLQQEWFEELETTLRNNYDKLFLTIRREEHDCH